MQIIRDSLGLKKMMGGENEMKILKSLTNAIPSQRFEQFKITNDTLFSSIRLKSISINLGSWLYALMVVNPKNVSEKWEKTGEAEMLSILCNSLQKKNWNKDLVEKN